MEWTKILEFFYEHFGEIALAIEFALFNVLGKKDPDFLKQRRLEKESKKREKTIARKEKETEKALEKAKCTMSQIEELKKEV